MQSAKAPSLRGPLLSVVKICDEGKRKVPFDAYINCMDAKAVSPERPPGVREVLVQSSVPSSYCPSSLLNLVGWNKPRQTDGFGQFLFPRPKSLVRDERY